MNPVNSGQVLKGRLKHVTSHRTCLFSGGWPRPKVWPAKNIHTDLEFALLCGMPTRGASGAMLQAYLVELMIDLFDEDWLGNGSLNLKFIRLVEMDDRIVAKGLVKDVQEDGLVRLDVWCENQLGEKVCTGFGIGRLAKPT